ncbi:SCP2 sterol-binding domain-containing protein [Ectothiorhodospiraceae bacterium WFHF3C12]|nr:SCP2 sterol-binding domain-containing protein [Ectothiorhodospiraceae bacterium WFHF3C12]
MTGFLSTLALREPLADGDLDELEGQTVRVEIHEPRLDLSLTVERGRIMPSRSAPAVTIRAQAEDLLLVAAQRLDPDTLFFQRRLSMSGDTALGLVVKNVLDTVAAAGLPAALAPWLYRLADLVPDQPADPGRMS